MSSCGLHIDGLLQCMQHDVRKLVFAVAISAIEPQVVDLVRILSNPYAVKSYILIFLFHFRAPLFTVTLASFALITWTTHTGIYLATTAMDPVVRMSMLGPLATMLKVAYGLEVFIVVAVRHSNLCMGFLPADVDSLHLCPIDRCRARG